MQSCVGVVTVRRNLPLSLTLNRDPSVPEAYAPYISYFYPMLWADGILARKFIRRKVHCPYRGQTVLTDSRVPPGSFPEPAGGGL